MRFKKLNWQPRKFLLYTVLLLYLSFLVFPIFWLVLSSLKTHYQVLQIPPVLNFRPNFQAYEKLWSGGMLKAFGNSLAIAGLNIVIALALGIPAGYGLARFKTGFNQNIGFWILSVRMAPAFGVIVPIYILIRNLRLLDTIVAVNLAHLTINLPFAIWLLKGYFEEMPTELEEAAMIDGASRMQALLRVVVPISMPMIIAVGLLTFIFSWNEFLFAFVLTSSSGTTVPVLVTSLAGTMRFDWPLMASVAVTALVPAFLLVSFVQKYIVRGLTLGALR
ncbi:MAG: carbohydrate ABC transporter permease [Candidatus Bipolaricaulia bacterium]